MNYWNNSKLIEVLKAGGVAVMPTDTLYGIVARAEDPHAVEKIYKIKNRNPEKKLITLIADWDETKKFGIDASKFKISKFTEPTTVILDEVSFRLPENADLRELLRQTGPLVAPSANPEGFPPAQDIEEAKSYFKEGVDIYVDGGTIEGKASKVIRLHPDGEVNILRA